MAADNKKALSYLDQLHSDLSKDEETTKRNKAILEEVLDGLKKRMTEADPLFRKAFKKFTYTGSSFEGLRIREVDEFDVNLIISLPIRDDEFELSAELPGFVSYTLTESGLNGLREREDGPVLQRLEKLLSKERRLLAQHFRTWFQSVVDLALRSYESSDDRSDISRVHPRQSGPAKTLNVFLDDGKRIDIDLVPVLEFSYDRLPKAFPRHKWIADFCGEIDKKWLMVPKNPKDKENSWRVHAWRVHFPDIEKKLIKDCGCVKPIIRLVKALRDTYKWQLSSYAIKTVVMRYRLEKRNKSDWHNEHQWTLLLEVLERLQGELNSDSGICYLFDERMNLIQDVKSVTRENIARCLKKRILRKLYDSPENIPEVFDIPLAVPVLALSPLLRVTPTRVSSAPSPGCKTTDPLMNSSLFSGNVTSDEVDAFRPLRRNLTVARGSGASSDSELERSHADGGVTVSNESCLDEASANSSDGASEASFADEVGAKSAESQVEKAAQNSSDFSDKARKVPFGESRINEVSQSTSDSSFESSFADELTAMSGESGFNEASQNCSEIESSSHTEEEAKIIIRQQLQFPVSDGSGDNVGTSVPNIKVTLSIAASDGRLLAEATCAMGDCRKLELEVPKTELPSRAEAASLVVTQRFKSTGKSPTFCALVSLKTNAGQQLAQARFSMQVCRGIHECQLRVPMPVLE